MDQVKIGCFIFTCRKQKGWTQVQMAEQLGITDKAVSKWERGKSLPDISLFMPLCRLLDISLNELLLGEHIAQEEFVEKSNQVLFDVITNWIGKEEEFRPEVLERAETVLKLRNVQKIYEEGGVVTKAVNDVSFDVTQGSVVGIMGASGSGKSTLLNLIASIDKPTNGMIEINGQSIIDISEQDLAKFRRDHLGFVFQEYN